MTPGAIAARNRMRVIIAFAAVYILWGSTYLFIKYAVAVIPPFVMGATRFFVASLAMYVAVRLRGAERPSLQEIGSAFVTGFLMLGVGNGAVIWSSQFVPSGIVSLIVAIVPLWIVLADWLGHAGTRPSWTVLLGVAVGIVGIIVLLGPRILVGRGTVHPWGAAVLVLGTLTWAAGSVLTRRAKQRSALMAVALQMLVAGITFLIAALVLDEFPAFVSTEITARAMWSWLYLVVFGSLVGYTAYVYLLGATSPAKAATYAYVNPVIAVALGWAFGGEVVGVRTLVAAAIILASVAIITTTQARAKRAASSSPEPLAPLPQEPRAA